MGAPRRDRVAAKAGAMAKAPPPHPPVAAEAGVVAKAPPPPPPHAPPHEVHEAPHEVHEVHERRPQDPRVRALNDPGERPLTNAYLIGLLAHIVQEVDDIVDNTEDTRNETGEILALVRLLAGQMDDVLIRLNRLELGRQ